MDTTIHYVQYKVILADIFEVDSSAHCYSYLNPKYVIVTQFRVQSSNWLKKRNVLGGIFQNWNENFEGKHNMSVNKVPLRLEKTNYQHLIVTFITLML